MVNYEQLLNMDTSKLAQAAETSHALSGKLSQRGSELGSASDIPAHMWEGADSRAAGSAIKAPVPFLYDSSDMFRNSQGALEALVEELEAAKSDLRSVQDIVAGTGITIGADGTITTPVVESAAEDQRNQELARQAEAAIRRAIDRADQADSTAEGQLNDSGGWAQDLLKYLNGGWQQDRPPGTEPSLLEKMTEKPGKESYLGGLLQTEVKHSEGDKLNSNGGLDLEKGNIGIGGDPTRSFEVKGPQLESGGVTAGSPGVKLHNSAIPGISVAEMDDSGRTQIKPKVQLPFVSVSSPVSVDPEKVGEQLSKIPAPKPLPLPRLPSW